MNFFEILCLRDGQYSNQRLSQGRTCLGQEKADLVPSVSGDLQTTRSCSRPFHGALAQSRHTLKKRARSHSSELCRRARESRLQTGPKLKIIGDGPFAPQVAQAAAANPDVEWLGACDREQVRQAMAAAKIFILPSTWYEGFPLVIAEAFAAGLPIVDSRLGAMAEFIADGHTIKLFASGSAAELAGAVEWVFFRGTPATNKHMRPLRIRAAIYRRCELRPPDAYLRGGSWTCSGTSALDSGI